MALKSAVFEEILLKNTLFSSPKLPRKVPHGQGANGGKAKRATKLLGPKMAICAVT